MADPRHLLIAPRRILAGRPTANCNLICMSGNAQSPGRPAVPGPMLRATKAFSRPQATHAVHSWHHAAGRPAGRPRTYDNELDWPTLISELGSLHSTTTCTACCFCRRRLASVRTVPLFVRGAGGPDGRSHAIYGCKLPAGRPTNQRIRFMAVGGPAGRRHAKNSRPLLAAAASRPYLSFSRQSWHYMTIGREGTALQEICV